MMKRYRTLNLLGLITIMLTISCSITCQAGTDKVFVRFNGIEEISVHPGGSFDYILVIWDYEGYGTYVFHDVWITVEGPNGEYICPVKLFKNVRIFDGFRFSNLIQDVPEDFPPSEPYYKYRTHIGVYPDTVYDTDEILVNVI